jgi:hypothetical protein
MLGKYNINEETLDEYYIIYINNSGTMSRVKGKEDIDWNGKRPMVTIEFSDGEITSNNY